MLQFIARNAYFFLRQRRFRMGPLPCFTVIPDFKSREWCERAQTELTFKSAAVTRTLEDDRIFGAEHLSSCANEFATDVALLARASAHAGNAEVLLFCMANSVTYRGGYGSGGEWHRDGFRHEMKALIYLTDVTDADGPFAIVEGSHTTWRILIDTLRMAFWGTRDATRLKNAGDRFGYRAFTAPAGTLILFDASSIHAGLPIKEGRERVALTNYYAHASEIETALAYYRDLVRLN
jgi:ectoine hydroxylase-related dioxygenase (phytanoyl-CoA dioxygenase family)